MALRAGANPCTARLQGRLSISIKPIATSFDITSMVRHTLCNFLSILRIYNSKKIFMRLITIALLWHWLIGHVNATCYYTDGTVSRNVLCRTGISCCRVPDDCRSNGICQDVNNHANGSLTIFPDSTTPLTFTGSSVAALALDFNRPSPPQLNRALFPAARLDQAPRPRPR